MSETVAYGDETQPNDIWDVAAVQLTPDKSLERVGTNARSTVTTVAVVGTLLGALGLASAQSALLDPISRLLAGLAVVAAGLAVLTALSYLALRLEKLYVGDLNAVENWYRRQFRRAYLAVVASWLLVVAVALATAAGLATLLTGESGADPRVGLRVSGASTVRSVAADGRIGRLEPDATVALRVTGESAGKAPVVLLESRAQADEAGKVIASGEVQDAPVFDRYRAILVLDGRVRAEVTVP